MSLRGVLSTYHLPNSDRRRPYFVSGDLDSTRALLFIGGLYNGLMDPPYLVNLSKALDNAGWALVQMYWSGCYDGFGTGSLDRDADEMGALVEHLGQAFKTIVLMGHSTGSQDVIHYLSTASCSPASSSKPSSSSARPPVQGGILQAPASDREYMEQNQDEDSRLWMAQLPLAEKMLAEGRGNELMDKGFCKRFGKMSAYRVHSLLARGGDDDYFSSDLPDDPSPSSPHKHPLSTSFGQLSVPCLALWSDKDEYGMLPDPEATLARWEEASKGRLKSAILKGADHAVTGEKEQESMCEMVVTWLKSLESESTHGVLR